MDFLQSESRSINNLRGSEGTDMVSKTGCSSYSGLISIVRYPTNDNYADLQIQPIILDDYYRTSLVMCILLCHFMGDTTRCSLTEAEWALNQSSTVESRASPRWS